MVWGVVIGETRLKIGDDVNLYQASRSAATS